MMQRYRFEIQIGKLWCEYKFAPRQKGQKRKDKRRHQYFLAQLLTTFLQKKRLFITRQTLN